MPDKDTLRSLAGPANLSDGEADRLYQLLSDWQVVADFSFSDLVLWLPTSDGRFVAVSHRRPGGAPTIHVDDIRGLYMPEMRARSLRLAMDQKRIVRPSNPRLFGVHTITEVIIPVVFHGRAIAVITRETSNAVLGLYTDHTDWYKPVAEQLCQMIAQGQFPYDEASRSGSHGMPRVADGAILIDEDGVVERATPNAVSCLRRLGLTTPLPGRTLAEDIAEVVISTGSVDESLPLVLMGRASWSTEVVNGRITVALRALPLRDGAIRRGAVILCRDLTEERQRERLLMSKDATIREIHHRVKNNLQTVSALLRLQARRSDSDEVKVALAQAERRITTIASIHEALSQNVDEVVDFDPVAKHVLRLAAKAATSDGESTVAFTGSFGRVGADEASALSVILSELVTNAVEHGLEGGRGEVEVVALRSDPDLLEVRVLDRGKGMEPGQKISGLGSQIVKTLVQSELGGTIVWGPRDGGGTEVVVRCRMS